MQVLSTSAEFVASNLKLPEALRQNAVLLEFAQPIRRSSAGQFLLIQLTPMMLAGGEEDFYLVGMAQPHRQATGRCRWCAQEMRRETGSAWRCWNPQCRTPDGRPGRVVQQVAGPSRGVVKLLITDDCLHHVDQTQVIDRFLPNGQAVMRRHTVEWLQAVVLLLDRRYRPEVLAAVKRTAGEICDLWGWSLAR